MELYWKGAAAVLLALILCQGIPEKQLSLLLAMAVCTMTGILLVHYLEPVAEFLRELEQLSSLQGNMLGILLKTLGIGLVTEIVEMMCRDSGNGSLGSALRLLGSAVILWLSLPLFRTLLDLLQRILGEL